MALLRTVAARQYSEARFWADRHLTSSFMFGEIFCVAIVAVRKQDIGNQMKSDMFHEHVGCTNNMQVCK